MTSSKVVRKHHHISRFIRRSLVLEMKPNTVQMPGTTTEGKKTDMAKSEGRAILTVDNLKTFYCSIEIPLCRMNQTHFFTKLEKQ